VTTFTSIFGPPGPPRKRLRFEHLQRFLSCTKIFIVEVASILGLLAILYEGLKHEIHW